jgi:O-methyltransferase involved in polyketide biosynthesis
MAIQRGLESNHQGVTQYLTAAAVDQTLAAIHRLAAPGSALIFTYVDRAAIEHGAAAFPEATRWIEGVHKRGEPWIFGLDPQELRGYLAGRGFELSSDVTTAEAGARYFPQRARAERASGLYRVATAAVAG